MKKKEIISIVLGTSFLLGSLFVFPRQVEAKNVFRNIGRGIKRTVRFVVTLPDKSTRWMGPVLGPIAADVLTGNLSRSARIGRIFTHANRADRIIKDVEEQRRLLNDLRTSYRDEANNLRNFAGDLKNHRQNLGQQLVQGQLNLSEYQQKIISLDRLTEAYEQTAQRFEDKADKINEGTIVRILANNATNTILGRVKDTVLFEMKNEINRYVKLDVISSLLDPSAITPDKLLEMLVAGDIKRLLDRGELDGVDTDELRERVRNRVKELLREEKESLKNNWKDKMNEIINQMAQEIKQEKDKRQGDSASLTPTISSSLSDDSEKENIENSPNDEDNDGCPNGYEFKPNSGVGCVQKNCLSVAHAKYDYTGHCSCGSAGSINENLDDPNKVCKYASSHTACPGCTYACVKHGEECPEVK